MESGQNESCSIEKLKKSCSVANLALPLFWHNLEMLEGFVRFELNESRTGQKKPP